MRGDRDGVGSGGSGVGGGEALVVTVILESSLYNFFSRNDQSKNAEVQNLIS
jgi:hypothetical protein